MLPLLIAVSAVLCLWFLVHRHRVREERRERRLLKRIARDYTEPHKHF